MDTKQLGALIETFAPLELQEDWDNCGYNVDLHNADVRRVLVCLDATQSIVQEAAERSCQVIISHHPLLFRPVCTVDSTRFPGSILTQLVRSGISLYCAHTTMDSASCGINTFVASLLGLKDVQPLTPSDTEMYKISLTVPASHAVQVRDALFEAGAGGTGLYCDCSFSVVGEGTFRPLQGAEPFIGETGTLETVREIRLEMLVPERYRGEALRAVSRMHPYEVPAVDLYRVKTALPARDGIGCVGQLPRAVHLSEFAQSVKTVLQCPEVLVTGAAEAEIHRVALCTGAGSSEIGAALSAGADVFVTGELKHNEYLEAPLPIIAAGHYDTEKWFCCAMRDALQKAGLGIQYKVDICMSTGMQRPYTVI